MYVKRHYSFYMTLRWSRKSLFYSLLYSSLITGTYVLTGIEFSLPWEPISVIGIAVAFYLGFKNNSSYDRTWEARKIWGAIVNDSRSFATAILTLPAEKVGEDSLRMQKSIIYRHLAWLHALGHVLRRKKSWEHQEDPLNLIYTPTFRDNYSVSMEETLKSYIKEGEWELYVTKTNIPTQLLKKQSETIKSLKSSGSVDSYQQVWLHQLISRLYDHQGMCERIKNFPLPRQYASTALWMNYLFCAFIPFGLLNIFETHQDLDVWLTIPFSTMIIWIFFLMDRIGDYSENPFEAAYNDVPVSSIVRAIEIDLKEMLDEKDIPAPYPVENGFLM
jgi:ion channel-forming bestrophin family protein